MPQITDPAFGDIASLITNFQLIGHDANEVSPADQTKRLMWANAIGYALQTGRMFNGKILPTVSGNNLIVALKDNAGADPSATSPVFININGTVRTVTAALSITLAAATNWYNAGSAELATKEIDYFCYAVWDSNSSAVALAPARIPGGCLVSDFSATTTNERYLGNYANYTATDDVVIIGRFAATLSAGAGYTWTVPTYTNINLVQSPIFETRRLDWTPAHTRSGGAYTNAPTVSNAHYIVMNNKIFIYERHVQNATPGSSGNQQFTLPFTNILSVGQIANCMNTTTSVQLSSKVEISSSTITLTKYDGTAEATASQAYTIEGTILG